MTRHRQGSVLLLLLSLVWMGGILSPLLGPDAAIVSRLVFSPVCHQEPARTFVVEGLPLAVCSRCTAVYGAFTLMALIVPMCRLRRGLSFFGLALFLLPMLLDVVLNEAGLVGNTMLSRTVTGAVAGVGFGWYLLPLWGEAWHALTRWLQSLFTNHKEFPYDRLDTSTAE